jgi:hypothetical protein
MHITHRRASVVDQPGSQSYRWLILCLLLVIALTSAGCARSANSPQTAAQRAASMRQIAADYARDGDLNAAQIGLGKLNLANPAQVLVSMAEQDVNDGRAKEEIVPIAELANALGARSPQVMAYLTPTDTVAPTATAADAAIATEAAAPTDAPTPTVAPAAPTPLPTVTITPTVVQPHVAAHSTVNLRSGPGTAYPVVGQLKVGQEAAITGRNASGDWWQLSISGAANAWVAGTIVNVLGPIDTVAVAQNIPALPPTATPGPTAPPAPTAIAVAPTAAPAPKPAGVQYVVQSTRLRPIGQDGQQCHGGDHSIWVYVKDAAGNLKDGVRVRELLPTSDPRIYVTGEKGPGAIQHPIWRGGGGQVDIVDDAGNRISEVSRSMSDDWPDFDLMQAAGYCSCKPHPDDASCKADLEAHNYLFAVGHYVYEVVFQQVQ